MNFNLNHFRIEGLHGNRTINIPIEDNKLILVGENGTGKSTVANFIYFFLTRQWWRMWQYKFDYVSLELNGNEYGVTRTEIIPENEEIFDFLRRTTSTSSRALRDLRNAMVHSDGLEDWIGLFSSIESEVPPSYLRRMFNRKNSLFTHKIMEFSDQIQTLFHGQQILYLPTYRRIEKELETILQRARYEEPRAYTRTIRHDEAPIYRASETDFLELVEFGMRDVEEQIDDTMSRLKDHLTNSLNNLTGTYLREVVLGTYETVDRSQLSEINVETVEAILSRVGEDFLSPNDKNLIIERIKQNIHFENEVVAHFLIRLNELYQRQQQKENNVKEFVAISNKYLKGKRLRYDNVRYQIDIYQTVDLSEDSSLTENTIKWRDMSSGEKQIISLFSHIYLNDTDKYFVIIDEPELSLSVPWQKQFLPDILSTERCTGLIAVTHSPFIFGNELKSYVYSLEDYMELNG